MKSLRSLEVILFVSMLILGIAVVAMADGQTFFKYSDLKVSPAPLSKIGEPITLHATVKNVGGYEGTTYANLYVDGYLAGSKEVTLRPGEAKEVSFPPVTFSKLGMHEVSIANLEAQKVKVYKDPLESAVLILDFDEGEGYIAHDKSGFGNDGVWKGTPHWVDGKFGKAVDTKETDFIEIPESPSLDITGKTITMMIWIYPIDEKPYSDFFTKGDWNVLKVASDTELDFFVGGWARAENWAKFPPNWNRNWHHVAGVCDGKTLKLYVDGELLNTVDYPPGPIGHTDFPWNIGRSAESPKGRETNGYLDEARIYLEPLSQEDILQIIKETEKRYCNK